MGKPEIQAQLREIVSLIKAGDRTAARERLRPLMKANPQNADVYYLASMVTDNADQRTKWLNEAVRLKPDHKQALAQLQKQPIAAGVPAAPSVPAPASPNRSRRQRWIVFAGVIGLVIIV